MEECCFFLFLNAFLKIICLYLITTEINGYLGLTCCLSVDNNGSHFLKLKANICSRKNEMFSAVALQQGSFNLLTLLYYFGNTLNP